MRDELGYADLGNLSLYYHETSSCWSPSVYSCTGSQVDIWDLSSISATCQWGSRILSNIRQSWTSIRRSICSTSISPRASPSKVDYRIYLGLTCWLLPITSPNARS